MRFKGLDLNLLVALDSLLELRHITRAAERLHMSQPAMSAALWRLRDYFGDGILVPHGKHFLLTPYAEVLRPRVRDLLNGVGELIAMPTRFDPATTERTFRILASDYFTVAVLAPLLRDLAVRAPGIRIDTFLPGEGSVKLFQDGKMDLFITPEAYLHPDHPAELLYEEEHVVVGAKGNACIAGGLDEELFYAQRHVVVRLGSGNLLSYSDREIEKRGRDRQIEVHASSFSVVPWLVVGTDRIAVMHRRLAEALVATFPIGYAELPFEMPAMRQMVQHHRSRSQDDDLAWLRAEISAAVPR